MISAFNIKMLKIVNKFFGSNSKRLIKSLSASINKINNFEPSLEKLSDDELNLLH